MRKASPTLALLATFAVAAALHAADQEPPGLGDPGQLTAIALETGRTVDGAFRLSGRDSAQQLLVTGQYDSGQTRDLSRDVEYTATPEGIVNISAGGYVSSIQEGRVTIHVKSKDLLRISSIYRSFIPIVITFFK